jgi:hypothetical protein
MLRSGSKAILGPERNKQAFFRQIPRQQELVVPDK